jgi:hypothetical protein
VPRQIRIQETVVRLLLQEVAAAAAAAAAEPVVLAVPAVVLAALQYVSVQIVAPLMEKMAPMGLAYHNKAAP